MSAQKQRLHQASLTQMKIGFGREKPFAGELFHDLKRETFGKRARLRDPDFAHQIGMRHEPNIASGHMKRHDVAPFARHFLQELRLIRTRKQEKRLPRAKFGANGRAEWWGLGHETSVKAPPRDG
jgi:hypothetical protein